MEHPYFVVKRDRTALMDMNGTWPAEYPYAVVSSITAWRVALFGCLDDATMFANALCAPVHTDADIASDPRA